MGGTDPVDPDAGFAPTFGSSSSSNSVGAGIGGAGLPPPYAAVGPAAQALFVPGALSPGVTGTPLVAMEMPLQAVEMAQQTTTAVFHPLSSSSQQQQQQQQQENQLPPGMRVLPLTEADEPPPPPPDPSIFAPFAPEKFMFCVDLHHDPRVAPPGSRTELDILKSALVMAVHVKARMSSQHQFALMVLRETAELELGFTNDVNLFCATVAGLQPEGMFHSLDMSSVVEIFVQQTGTDELLLFENPQAPHYLMRLVLLYSRSTIIPSRPEGELYEWLIGCKNFFVDTVFLHEKASETCNPQGVFDYFGELEPPPPGRPAYVFEGTPHPRRALQHLAKLLANAVQRPDLASDLNASLYSATPHLKHPPPQVLSPADGPGISL